MAAKGAASGSLNAKNLEALGTARLAELLMILCEGNNASKRLLRLALAEQKGPLEMARELRKRLASIARASSLLDDHQRDELVRELERQRLAICGPIADHDADLAVDLLWEVLELSGGLIERCDDRDAVLRDWFDQASAALGQVALAARGKPQNLADQVYAAVVSNSCGQFDPIVRDLAPALGPEGLAICACAWTSCASAPAAPRRPQPSPTGSCASPCSTSPMPWAMPSPIWRSIATTTQRRLRCRRSRPRWQRGSPRPAGRKRR
jgi:hypothetical protein